MRNLLRNCCNYFVISFVIEYPTCVSLFVLELTCRLFQMVLLPVPLKCECVFQPVEIVFFTGTGKGSSFLLCTRYRSASICEWSAKVDLGAMDEGPKVKRRIRQLVDEIRAFREEARSGPSRCSSSPPTQDPLFVSPAVNSREEHGFI